jgi:hypothetical protein
MEKRYGSGCGLLKSTEENYEETGSSINNTVEIRTRYLPIKNPDDSFLCYIMTVFYEGRLKSLWTGGSAPMLCCYASLCITA